MYDDLGKWLDDHRLLLDWKAARAFLRVYVPLSWPWQDCATKLSQFLIQKMNEVPATHKKILLGMIAELWICVDEIAFVPLLGHLPFLSERAIELFSRKSELAALLAAALPLSALPAAMPFLLQHRRVAKILATRLSDEQVTKSIISYCKVMEKVTDELLGIVSGSLVDFIPIFPFLSDGQLSFLLAECPQAREEGMKVELLWAKNLTDESVWEMPQFSDISLEAKRLACFPRNESDLSCPQFNAALCDFASRDLSGISEEAARRLLLSVLEIPGLSDDSTNVVIGTLLPALPPGAVGAFFDHLDADQAN
jgi:hypothetical protein